MRFKERRLFERIQINFPLELQDTHSKTQAYSKDLSGAGMGIILKKEPPSFKGVWLKLHIPDGRDSCILRGSLVWKRKIKNDLFRIGLRFESIRLFRLWRIFRILKSKRLF